MLCDPFKYQDYVRKYLDEKEEEEEEELNTGGQRQSNRKRTRSNNFFTQTALHEIDEEIIDEHKKEYTG